MSLVIVSRIYNSDYVDLAVGHLQNNIPKTYNILLHLSNLEETDTTLLRKLRKEKSIILRIQNKLVFFFLKTKLT